MLKYRILTAAFLIPLVFVSVFYTSPLIFQLILATVLLLTAWEWTSLSRLNDTKERILYLLLLAFCFYVAESWSMAKLPLIGLGAVWWLWVASQIIMQKPSRFFTVQNSMFVAGIGVLIFTTCFAALSFLRGQSQNWVMTLLLIVWLADTAAYFSGRQFGKRLLAPKISPKKTWEGACGALITVFLSILWMGWLCGLKLLLVFYLSLLGSCTVIISIVGDLFESLLKRKVGVKDSGQLLPGHGGLLDRMDSLLAAAPFFALGVVSLRVI